LIYHAYVWFTEQVKHDALPKGPTGKILKREIQAPAEFLDRTPAVTDTSTA
jgi:acyl-coenzyme A synthetase/AMP-(fatty) acid ligase